MQIDVTRQFCQRGLHRQRRSGENAHFQVEIVERRLGIGNARRRGGLGQQELHIAGWNLGEARHRDGAGERGVLQRAVELQRLIGRDADAGVAEANVTSVGGQIKADGGSKGDEAAKLYMAAAHAAGHILHLKPVAIEDQRAIDVAQSSRHDRSSRHRHEALPFVPTSAEPKPSRRF